MKDPRSTRLFVVDRLEGRGETARVVLVSDDDEVLNVSRAFLKKLAVEGAVLRVPFTATGPEWTNATRDRAEERRRIADAKDELRRLSADDPGGDLSL